MTGATGSPTPRSNAVVATVLGDGSDDSPVPVTITALGAIRDWTLCEKNDTAVLGLESLSAS
jgi:hypothetical protein